MYTQLEEEGIIHHLNSVNEDVWNQVQEGGIIETNAAIEFSAVETIFDSVSDLVPLLETFSPESLKDKKSQEILGYLQILVKNQKAHNIKIIPSGVKGKFQFVASLPIDKVRVSKNELADEFTVLCRVRQKLKQNEKFELFSLVPGEFKLPRKEVRELLRHFKDIPPILGRPPKTDDLYVNYPAMVVTPIAIYR